MDLPLEAVGQIGGVNQRKGGGREQVPLLALGRGLLDDHRRVPFGEEDADAFRFEPLLDQIELRALTGAVQAFDRNQAAQQLRLATNSRLPTNNHRFHPGIERNVKAAIERGAA
jgi:hypothetical protein